MSISSRLQSKSDTIEYLHLKKVITMLVGNYFDVSKFFKFVFFLFFLSYSSLIISYKKYVVLWTYIWLFFFFFLVKLFAEFSALFRFNRVFLVFYTRFHVNFSDIYNFHNNNLQKKKNFTKKKLRFTYTEYFRSILTVKRLRIHVFHWIYICIHSYIIYC